MLGKKYRTRNPASIIALITVALAAQLLWGCASTTRVDEALVAKYQPPATPNDHETMIYVIRPSSFVGAARNVWVSCNDQYIAKLYSGSYCFFKVPAGLNTINIEQSGISLSYHQVDNRKGETVFLKLEYTKGHLMEVPRDLGITLVMQNKQGEKYEGSDKSDQYKTALLNPGFVGLDLMKTAATDSSDHPEGAASITFFRNQSLAEDVPFGVWSREGWLGDLKGNAYFKIKPQPGKHLFFCNAGSWSVCEINVEPGKQYFVRVQVERGWHEPDIKFIPVEQNHELNALIKASQEVTPSEVAINAAVRSRLDAAAPLIEEAMKNLRNGSLVPISLNTKNQQK